MRKTLAQHIANALTAHRNCVEKGNPFADTWIALMDYIEANALPSGSGFDNGTTIDRENVFGRQFNLKTSFHHMDDQGFYDGWTHHKIKVFPDWQGIDLKVATLVSTLAPTTESDRESLDYIGETFYHVLGEFWDLGFDREKGEHTFTRTPKGTS